MLDVMNAFVVLAVTLASLFGEPVSSNQPPSGRDLTDDAPIMVTPWAAPVVPTSVKNCIVPVPRTVRIHSFKTSDGSEFVRHHINSALFQCWSDFENMIIPDANNILACGEATLEKGLNTFHLHDSVCTAYLGRPGQSCRMSGADTVVYVVKTTRTEFVPTVPEITSVQLSRVDNTTNIEVYWMYSDNCLVSNGVFLSWDDGSIELDSSLNNYTILEGVDCSVNNVTVTILDDLDSIEDVSRTETIVFSHAIETTSVQLSRIDDTTSIEVSWDYSKNCTVSNGVHISWDNGSTEVDSSLNKYTIMGGMDCVVNTVIVTILDDVDSVQDASSTETIDLFHDPEIASVQLSRGNNDGTIDVSWTYSDINVCFVSNGVLISWDNGSVELNNSLDSYTIEGVDCLVNNVTVTILDYEESFRTESGLSETIDLFHAGGDTRAVFLRTHATKVEVSWHNADGPCTDKIQGYQASFFDVREFIPDDGSGSYNLVFNETMSCSRQVLVHLVPVGPNSMDFEGKTITSRIYTELYANVGEACIHMIPGRWLRTNNMIDMCDTFTRGSLINTRAMYLQYKDTIASYLGSEAIRVGLVLVPGGSWEWSGDNASQPLEDSEVWGTGVPSTIGVDQPCIIAQKTDPSQEIYLKVNKCYDTSPVVCIRQYPV